MYSFYLFQIVKYLSQMRYTHRDMQRTFEVPFGPWLIPVLGSSLCILFMLRVSKTTAFRFLVWTAFGQIVYFSYGFWHSKRHQLKQVEQKSDPLEATSPEESSV